MRLVLYQGPPELGEAIQWNPPKTYVTFEGQVEIGWQRQWGKIFLAEERPRVKAQRDEPVQPTVHEQRAIMARA